MLGDPFYCHPEGSRWPQWWFCPGAWGGGADPLKKAANSNIRVFLAPTAQSPRLRGWSPASSLGAGTFSQRCSLSHLHLSQRELAFRALSLQPALVLSPKHVSIFSCFSSLSPATSIFHLVSETSLSFFKEYILPSILFCPFFWIGFLYNLVHKPAATVYSGLPARLDAALSESPGQCCVDPAP